MRRMALARPRAAVGVTHVACSFFRTRRGCEMLGSEDPNHYRQQARISPVEATSTCWLKRALKCRSIASWDSSETLQSASSASPASTARGKDTHIGFRPRYHETTG